jgi:hypothetical protein
VRELIRQMSPHKAILISTHIPVGGGSGLHPRPIIIARGRILGRCAARRA